MTRTPMRILLVEDHRADAVLLQEILLQEAPGEFEIAWTTSLRETLERLGRESFEAVLLDLSLPDSHGLETITRLSAALPSMPILVTTGLTDEHVAGEAVRCGAEDYLVKGQTDARSLIRAIRYAIDRKQAEEALRTAKNSAEQAKAAAEHANRAKDHFLAVLSHELRTPLTPVVMGLSMLQDRTDLEPGVRETLEMVRRNVELEARLIDDLLERLADRAGEDRTQPRPCRVVYDHSTGDRSLQARHRGADVALRPGLGAGRAYWIEADAARMQQVFWNLLKNAVKFTPRGGCVGIRCRPNEERVVVEVSDSGIGIEAGALERIFNAFEQAERSITQQFGGLGLGLAISKALVEMHGGRIEAQSEGQDRGATFRVWLPLATSPSRRQERPAAMPPRQVVRPLRRLAGGRPRGHGQADADRACRRRPFRGDGRRRGHGLGIGRQRSLRPAAQRSWTARRQRLRPDARIARRGHKFPGIALSGYGQREDVQRSRDAGFAAHLTKPASREAIVAAVASVTEADYRAN